MSEGISNSGIDRRQLLRGVVGGGVAIAAGCLGDDPEGEHADDDDDAAGDTETDDETTDDDTDTDDDDEGEETGDTDATLTLCDIYNPQDLQYNWLNPSDSGAEDNTPGELLYDRFMLYTPETDEYHTDAFIIDDWSYDGDSLTVEISDGHYWHDGDQVTAEDVVAHWQLDIYSYEAAGSDHPYLSEVEGVDETTVEFTLHEELDEDLLLQYHFTGVDDRLYTKASLYEEWLEDLEGADDSEFEERFSELQNEAFEDPVGNGPFQYESASEQSMRLELFEDHPSAEEINFSEVEWRAFSDGQAELQAIEAGEIDVVNNISPQEESIMEQWPAGLDTPRLDMPNYGGNSLKVQHDHEFLSIPEVRRAFMHVINRDDIAVNTPENLEALEVPAGVPMETADEWVGDLLEDLDTYETDEETAADLMEEAGFERDGDQWIDDDGEQLSLTIKTPPWADTWVPVAQTASSNLSEFGIDAEMVSQEVSAWADDTNTGDFDLIVDGWGGSPHPYTGLEDIFDGLIADSSNIPEEIEVPPVGEHDADETETIDVVDTVRSIPFQDEGEMQESIQQLAWVVNQNVPVMTLSDGFGTGWIFQPDDWEFTTDDEDLLAAFHPIMYGIRMGIFRATE